MHRVWTLRLGNAGNALIEFAIVLPVLLFMFLGMVEVAHYLLFREKMESAAAQLLDVLNQGENVDANSLNNLIAIVPEMMRPYPAISAQAVITHMAVPPTTAVVNGTVVNCRSTPVALWQYPEGVPSEIANGKGNAATTGDITLQPAEHVMAMELTVQFKPILDNSISRSLIGTTRILHTGTYAHSRYGSFNLDPSTREFVDPATYCQ